MRELLTSPRSFLDANLATSIYNVTPPATGFQSMLLDLQTRQGILTRAGFLAAHADVDSSGPVPRGVFVLNALLCVPPLSPPPNVPSPPPVAETISAHQTTRQRFGMHLSESFCSSCHDTIDGVGFGFEEFDGVGVYRTTENGSPVDTSGNLRGSDVDGPFVGASQLAQKLVNSKEVLGCLHQAGVPIRDGAAGVLRHAERSRRDASGVHRGFTGDRCVHVLDGGSIVRSADDGSGRPVTVPVETCTAPV